MIQLPIVLRHPERLTIVFCALQPEQRHRAMANLVHHPGFRAAHPREEHFVPIYAAEGAGSTGGPKNGARLVCGLWGAKTVFWGV